MPTAVLIWVWFCAYLNCAGWALSAIHELNAAGYAVALLLGFAALIFWRRRTAAQILPHVRWQKFRRRFRRPFPLAFLILAALAFLSGALYAPNNYDALAYRIPRVLHWLAAGQWHWIHTIFPRVNGRACGIEWVSAPFIALLKTDRLLFLINIVSFLLLPGLVFSVFTRLGVRRRVAWSWMWMVPTGYCFLLQAGSIGNDLFGAPFPLAAVGFALRAKTSRAPRDFFASVLAAAMMTSAKTSNLPLLLPWAIALLPSLKLALRWPLRTLAVCLIASTTSFLPTAILNAHFCGDWTGMTLENGLVKGRPVLRTGANAALVTVQNLTPPVFPYANMWDCDIQQIIPAGLRQRLHQTIPTPEAADFHVEELQIEENAGLGFGVCILFLASIVVTTIRSRFALFGWRIKSTEALWQTSVQFAPWISFTALLSQSVVYPIGRILAPYYALLIPPFLTSAAHERLLRQCWWRVSAFAVFVIAAALLIVSPARPLFPSQMILGKIRTDALEHPLLARAQNMYSVYRERWDAFAPVRAILPADATVLGMVTSDDPETSLWRPFGSLRIEHVCPGDTLADLKRHGIEYVLVKTDGFANWFGCSPDDWVKQMNARLVQKISLNLRVSRGALDWYLVKLP